MRTIALMFILGAATSCHLHGGDGYVAVVEVPVRSDAERQELVRLLKRHAAEDGELHVDDMSQASLKEDAEFNIIPAEMRATMNVSVWRGQDDDEFIADIRESSFRRGPWLSFAEGKPRRFVAFRSKVLRAIKQRWPNTRDIPILPSGGVPHPRDLTLTPVGYRINRAAAGSYELPASSPLLAQNISPEV